MVLLIDEVAVPVSSRRTARVSGEHIGLDLFDQSWPRSTTSDEVDVHGLPFGLLIIYLITDE